ncbi:MAG TPA: type I polyketide synthase, partial [Pilimelia sp.]|nr:type I polyketide synthase [Pilimelia sp.]
VPVAVYLETLLAAQDAVYGHTRGMVRDLRLGEPLELPEEGTVPVRTRFAPRPDGTADVRIARGDDGRTLFTAVVAPRPGPDDPAPAAPLPGATAVETVSGEDWYAALADAGLTAGDEFRRLALVERVPHLDRGAADRRVVLHGRPLSAVEHLPPGVLQAALHAAQLDAGSGELLAPVAVERFRLFRKPTGPALTALVRPAAAGPEDDGAVDLTLFDGAEAVCQLGGVRLRRAQPGDDGSRSHFLHALHWVPREAEPAAASGARRVLVVHRGPGAHGASRLDADGLAAEAARAGDAVTVVSSAAEAAEALRAAAFTDVCWLWRPPVPHAAPAPHTPRAPQAPPARSTPGTLSAAETAPPAPAAGLTVDALRAQAAENYRDLLALLAALGEAGFGRDQRLWLVTQRGQWLPDDAPGTGEDLAATTLWGFGHVLLNEYPTYRVTMLDLPAGDVDPAALLAQVRTPDTGDFQVAVRAGRRYVRRLRPYTPGPAAREVPIRADRAYLVTGGLGALGLVTARKLVDLGARHLALVSRRAVPAAEVAQLRARLGQRAEVTVLRGDIARPEDVARIMAGLPRPLAGVVHAAGLLDDRPVSAQTWESIDALFEAKVYGAWLLHEATRDLPDLDFFVAYSSAASVVGGASQSNYAAANAFLDGLVHWRARQGLPALAVNWGPWAEVGMSARLSAQHVRALEAEGISFFAPARALRALVGLLGQSDPQVAAGECDWARFTAAKPVRNALYEELVRDRGGRDQGLDLSALLAQPRAERTAVIDEFVRVQVAGVLHLEDAEAVESHVEFVQLGLDSLVAMELKNALEAAFRIPLPASIAFDHPSAGQLAEFLDSQLVPQPTG